LKTLAPRRHLRHGYHVCDEQHCQVYQGVAAETERSRAVVEATRGRVLAYRGRVAHVLYSSNCGGHTQSGSEVSGWGDVAYWQGSRDADPGAPPAPRSPWELRWRLRETPPAFCIAAPSGHVHPSHYRWTRLLDARALEERINRKEMVGRLKGIRPLRRSASGHLNAVMILGSRRKVLLTKELRIRNLLGVGSLRSALFSLETEDGPDGRPSRFILHGGGWGHGVGMCQSGAMGRAEQGQLYDEILRAYYPGVELGRLPY
jgi:SpoIID/LytB domain protein